MSYSIIPLSVCFICAFIFGWFTWIAKNVWRNKTRTQIFALLAVIFTVSFMILAWEYL
ncbi:MAG: hypothetical protein KKE04_00980 [Candidatus Thermoplasmatota archaeon]|nr:hypothetical protein [Candidatus Thermoplasmatota archaeon]MBU3901926.1 hypothetical protein [Candidatus Thermoplasmatota archaeon]MBU4256351.1 hypothetical protein [Candidatus Thermoplasmatota archaeon]MCG2827141.1 hypothetical protein [Thermoplasmatales archaeon]